MMDLSLEDIEFIKILATSDATILQAGMNEATKKRLDDRVGVILRKYYHENTRNKKQEAISSIYTLLRTVCSSDRILFCYTI